MASYDNAEITERERLAAKNQNTLARYNAQTTKNQLDQQIKNYDLSNTQNRSQADKSIIDARRQNEVGRFEAQRDLQNSALGLFGSMNQAMNGSTVGNAMYMFKNRNDKDNNTYWDQLRTNINSIEDNYNEALNQNTVARNDAVINAEATLRNMEADLAANLNNINPRLFVAPGQSANAANQQANQQAASGSAASGVSTNTTSKDNNINANLDSSSVRDKMAKANQARVSGYLTPANYQYYNVAQPNQLKGNDYYSRLINGFNL